MMWIKLFNFSIRHVPERKYNAVNSFSWKSENLSLNKKADAVNDFINLQLNNIQVCSVFIKESEKFTVLENNYSEKLINIAVFLISLQWSLNLTTREF